MLSWTGIHNTIDVFRKTTANTVGQFTASPSVSIIIPPNAAPGIYTGTITVTYPTQG